MHTHLLRGELRVLTMLNRRAATMQNNVTGGGLGEWWAEGCSRIANGVPSQLGLIGKLMYTMPRKRKKKERKPKIPRARFRVCQKDKAPL